MDRGRPRKFINKQALETSFKEYLDYCIKYKRLANVSGFCVYSDMNRDTYYAQKEYYSDTFKKIELMLEDETINNPHISPTEKIFYLKSKFKYIDKQVIESHNKHEVSSLDRILKAVKDE